MDKIELFVAEMQPQISSWADQVATVCERAKQAGKTEGEIQMLIEEGCERAKAACAGIMERDVVDATLEALEHEIRLRRGSPFDA